MQLLQTRRQRAGCYRSAEVKQSSVNFTNSGQSSKSRQSSVGHSGNLLPVVSSLCKSGFSFICRYFKTLKLLQLLLDITEKVLYKINYEILENIHFLASLGLASLFWNRSWGPLPHLQKGGCCPCIINIKGEHCRLPPMNSFMFSANWVLFCLCLKKNAKTLNYLQWNLNILQKVQ